MDGRRLRVRAHPRRRDPRPPRAAGRTARGSRHPADNGRGGDDGGRKRPQRPRGRSDHTGTPDDYRECPEWAHRGQESNVDDIGTVAFRRNAVFHRDGTPNGELDIQIVGYHPRIRVSPEFLDGSGRFPFLDPYVHLNGDILIIRDDYGARFIYRINWDDYADGGYLAEWPD